MTQASLASHGDDCGWRSLGEDQGFGVSPVNFEASGEHPSRDVEWAVLSSQQRSGLETGLGAIGGQMVFQAISDEIIRRQIMMKRTEF